MARWTRSDEDRVTQGAAEVEQLGLAEAVDGAVVLRYTDHSMLTAQLAAQLTVAVEAFPGAGGAPTPKVTT